MSRFCPVQGGASHRVPTVPPGKGGKQLWPCQNSTQGDSGSQCLVLGMHQAGKIADSKLRFQKILGWPKVPFGFSVRCNGKTRTNLLVSPINRLLQAPGIGICGPYSFALIS